MMKRPADAPMPCLEAASGNGDYTPHMWTHRIFRRGTFRIENLDAEKLTLGNDSLLQSGFTAVGL